jgi:hypothetical protein
MLVRMALLVSQCAADFRQAPNDPFVDDETTAHHRADTRRDLGVEHASVAAGDLDAREISGAAFGNVLTPDAGKLHIAPPLPPGETSFTHIDNRVLWAPGQNAFPGLVFKRMVDQVNQARRVEREISCPRLDEILEVRSEADPRPA